MDGIHFLIVDDIVINHDPKMLFDLIYPIIDSLVPRIDRYWYRSIHITTRLGTYIINHICFLQYRIGIVRILFNR